MTAALLLSGVTFASTMAGGLAALRWPTRIEWLMALAGGVVLGAALFDLLPEALDHAEEHGMGMAVPFGAVLAGFLVFNAAERFAHRHEDCGDHHHEHPGAAVPPSASGVVGAAGFVAHSFFDGLAIGLGFQVDHAVGLLIALAVIVHDFSDGLNTVTLLTAARHPTDRSRRWLVAVATAPLAGALVGTFLPVPDEVLPLTLGFFSGLFLYAAATHLLPAAHRLPALGSFLVTASGAAMMLAIASAAGH
ncbi:MAG: ZIP family metal transporter [Solirubrobacterales bacterium]|nr:ZIP family metal transporter [Solirubrobacterales bacterium]